MVFGSMKKHARSEDHSSALTKQDEANALTTQDTESSEVPPPPYQPALKPSANNLPSEKDTTPADAGAASATKYPQQPYHTPHTVRHINVKYTNWKATRVVVYEESESSPLYNIHARLFKPQLVITNPASSTEGHTSEDDPLATVDMHCTSSRIDIHMARLLAQSDSSSSSGPLAVSRKDLPSVTMHKTHGCGMTYTYPCSSIPGVESLTWSTKGVVKMDIECHDDKGRKVAFFSWGKAMHKKFGGLDVYIEECRQGSGNREALEDVVFSAMAYCQFVYYVVATYGAAAA